MYTCKYSFTDFIIDTLYLKIKIIVYDPPLGMVVTFARLAVTVCQNIN